MTDDRLPVKNAPGIVGTVRRPRIQTKQVEWWAAESADGVWRFDRIEITRTPWEATHVPSGETAGVWASLPKIARNLAAGNLERQRNLDRLDRARAAGEITDADYVTAAAEATRGWSSTDEFQPG